MVTPTSVNGSRTFSSTSLLAVVVVIDDVAVCFTRIFFPPSRKTRVGMTRETQGGEEQEEEKVRHVFVDYLYLSKQFLTQAFGVYFAYQVRTGIGYCTPSTW